MNNVTGSLKEIDGVYYIVLNYKDKDGNYKHKRINTKLTVRGNKKAAEQQLQEALENFSIEEKQEKKPVNKIKLMDYEELLLKRKAEIEKNKKLYGKSYISKYDEYVFVDDYGELIKPKFVTDTFKKILKKNNLKRIRFHDLRHSCASLLLANGVPMKNIQEWLGHANFSTTADVYSHLDYSSKMQSANIIDEQLSSKKIELISLEELDREIAKLKKMIDEKESMKKKKQKNCEME